MTLGRAMCTAVLLAGTTLGACGGSTKVAPSVACHLNSDCDAPLVCALGYCVGACRISRDCPNDERCVIVGSRLVAGDGGIDSGADGRSGAVADGGSGGSGGGGGAGGIGAGGTGGAKDGGAKDGGAKDGGGAGDDGGSAGTAQGTACQAPETVACQYNSQCKSPLVCGSDHQCRDMCETNVDCPMQQVCTSMTKLCADPTVDKDYSSTLNDFVLGTGGGGGKGGSTDGAVDGAGGGGIKPDAATGPLGFVPSNFDPTTVVTSDAGATGIDWSKAPAATVSTSCENCLPMPAVTINMSNGSPADLYVLESLIVSPTAGLRLSGPRPIILAVRTTVDIQGQLLVNGRGYASAGPGGFAGVYGGPGAGQGGVAAYAASGDGGGSYCGVGGKGYAATPPAAPGGHTYGGPEIVPLLGGSEGGCGGSTCSLGGAGGGAIQIVAGTSITVRALGAINAGGGGGDGAAGGGGAGGAILLEAPTVAVLGALAANGGGGASGYVGGGDGTADDQPVLGVAGGGNGSAAGTINGGDGTTTAGATGGGGAGRIRINTASGTPTIAAGAIVSPSLGTACATEGKI